MEARERAACLRRSRIDFYGGKSRIAPLVWERLGNPVVYVEPFAGSLACLLARPEGGGAREIVCDLDGGIANFWRAVEADADEVAYWADYPTIHQDLTARHKWLKAWFAENAAELSNDPFFYDARVAGWWVWGISLWIGGGWCNASSVLQDGTTRDGMPQINHKDTGASGVSALRYNTPGGTNPRPHVTDQIPRSKWPGGGQGVSAQRPKTPGGKVEHNTPDKIPFANNWGTGQGVNAQRKATPGGDVDAPDQRPFVGHKGGGQGINAQRSHTPDQRPHVAHSGGGDGVSAQRATRPDLVQWFRAIQARLKGVIVLNRSWESALTPTLLMHTPSSPKPPVGILMDPPYITDDRQAELYGSDADGSSSSTAHAAYLWAVEHGDVFRIAYCCHEGDFPVPDGWTANVSAFGGIKDEARRAARHDLVMFSPACLKDPQLSLW